VSRRSSYLLLLLFVVAALLLFVPLPIPPTYAGRTIENAGHTPLFFIVTLAILFMLRDRPRFAGWRLYVAAGAIGISLGFLSEVVQRPLARDASWEDVGADAIGSICALAAYALFDRHAGVRRWHRVIAAVVAASCLIVYLSPIYTMTRAYLHRNGQFPVIASFDSRIELYWTMSIGVYRDVVNDALEVIFVAKETPGIGFHEPIPDWTGFGWLVLDVENPANEPLKLGVRVHDKSHNWQYHDRFNREFDLPAGERRSIRISLDEIRRGPRNRPMDMTRISNISLFRGANTGSRHLRIHTIRLE
jgi:VanZ family protein